MSAGKCERTSHEQTTLAKMDNQAKKRAVRHLQAHGPSHVHGSTRNKVNLDAKSERNAVFYKQDGFTSAYPKLQVYPPEGGEVQLEQLRARLHRYAPPPPSPPQNELSCDDMEMTMACTTNITILPGLNNKENADITKHTKHPSHARQPLQPVVIPSSSSLDENLERMCGEKQELEGSVVTGGKEKEDSEEALSAVLDNLVLQQSPQQWEPEKQIINGCATRLNFSDAESSIGTSQLSSLMEDSVRGRGSVLGHSQVRLHEQSGTGMQSFEVFHDSWRNQSHNTSHGRQPALQPVKHQPAARCFGKPLDKKAVNRDEADIPSLAESYQSYDQSRSIAGASKSNMSSFSVYEDSVEQSSLAPFHDSWAKDTTNRQPAISKDNAADAPGSSFGPDQQQVERKESDVVYHAALGVPLEKDTLASGNVSVVDQSFTQIGICHPKHAPKVSTPASKRIDLTFDLSRIQTETEVLPPSARPPNVPLHPSSSSLPSATQRKRSVVSAAINLSTIKEESSSLKSSRSSAAISSSSSSCSQSSHESLGAGNTSPPAAMDVNPFSPEIVNMMLNSLSPNVVDSVYCTVPGVLPQLVSGRTVALADQEYPGLKKMTSGGFGTIYTCKRCKETKVLKVVKPALKWEIAIISELHSRLQASQLMFGSQCFVKVEQSFVFDNASVLVLPYYKHGSLLDLANAHGTHLHEPFLFYYTAELLEIVSSLHHCGILHTDIKPDNFMLADISLHKSFASAHGHGLVLIDFGRAVDLTAFSGDVLFQGSCETEGFQCSQMLEGKPWKYEADYFGIAATVHVLLTGQYMSVVKDSQGNCYRLQKPLRRSYHPSLWNDFFHCLLNTTQPLPLSELAAEMRAKLEGIKDFVFQAFSKNVLTATLKQVNSHQ